MIYVCTENSTVIYPDEAEPYLAETLAEREEDGEELVRNHLNQYFALNRSLTKEERERHTFVTMPNDFRWDVPKKEWQKRDKPLKNGIIRVAHVSPGNNELHVVLG